MESSSQTRARAQVAALEAKIQNLEEQNQQESQERLTLNRQYRRVERRLLDTLQQLEDEKRNSEQTKEFVSIQIFLKLSFISTRCNSDIRS